VILTNQWTEVTWGHGRPELRLTKSLLFEEGIFSRILSASKEFGDIHFEIDPQPTYLPKVMLRGPIYRKNEKIRERNLARKWANINSLVEEPLVVSSGLWPQLIALLKLEKPKKVLYRLIYPPNFETTDYEDIELVRNAQNSGRLILGIETLDGYDYLEERFRISALLVPPLTTLNEVNISAANFGIFWSVTDASPPSEISKVIQQNSTDKMVIKLPLGVSTSDLTCDLSNIRIISNGITDLQFAEELKELKYAYLPHQNYQRRGSGLVTSMLGSGIFVLAHKSNSFLRDFSFSKLLINVDEEEPSKTSYLDYLPTSTIDRHMEAVRVNNFVKEKWLTFLGLAVE
jgi:hypothetical protein